MTSIDNQSVSQSVSQSPK